MARSHWRFIVRDAYGYALQNARVYVYQPDTTTAFLGSAYTAASGGSPVTSPQLTGPQGEVEAWFDTAQNVDVFVDDNTDTAYRATDGAGVIASFTAFTERDEILPDYSDINTTVVGVAGDLVLAITNPFTSETAAAGAVGKYADAGHKHPYTALTPAVAVVGRSAASAGALLNPSRSDHIHPFASALGRTSKFTTASDTLEQLIHGTTIPANVVAAGSMFRIQLRAFQTNSTTAITYTFRARWGGLAGVLVGNSLALVGTTTTHTDNPVSLEFLMTVPVIGATGSATGVWFGSECITTTTANTPKLVVAVQTAAATIDTTVDKDIAITVQMNLTTGTPNLEVDDVLIEQVA